MKKRRQRLVGWRLAQSIVWRRLDRMLQAALSEAGLIR